MITRARSASLVALAATVALAQGGDRKEPPLENPEQEKLVSKDPRFSIERPNKEWVFIDLERARAKEIARRGDARSVELEFAPLKARLWHGGHPADLFVYAYEETRDDATDDVLGEEQLDATKKAFKDAKVTSRSRAALGKRRGLAFEVEGTLLDGKTALAVSKVVVWRQEDKRLFVISLECARDKAKLARKDWPRLLKGISLD